MTGSSENFANRRLALDVDMRRLGAFVAEKEEPVWSDSRNGWHLKSSGGSIHRSVARGNRNLFYGDAIPSSTATVPNGGSWWFGVSTHRTEYGGASSG